MNAPFGFRVELDPDLFALDRLDALFRRVPEGKQAIWHADKGRERPPGHVPSAKLLRKTIAEDLASQRLHLVLRDVTSWAPEYADARRQVLEAAGTDPSRPRYVETTIIRLFSADVPVALHADGETQLNVGVGGRNLWHVYPPSSLSQAETDALLRGGRFMHWRDMTLFQDYDLGINDAFGAPPRWPHWIEHPGPDPAVSFEVGYWTVDDIHARKVWDVNYTLRKLHMSPRPPGENPGIDRRKRKAFDLFSLVTRRGGGYRGV
jgi:hypothetical protein